MIFLFPRWDMLIPWSVSENDIVKLDHFPRDRPENQKKQFSNRNWLVVSTHSKNISQNGNLPQIGVKIKNIFETAT